MEAEKIDTNYFKELLQKGIRDIFEAQRLIANKRIYQSGHERIRQKREGNAIQSRSGALMAALNNPKYLLSNDGDGVHAELAYPLYLRFLDMKRVGNWQIYNRQLWGILYKETFVQMRYGFSEWLTEFTHKTLTQSFQPLTSK